MTDTYYYGQGKVEAAPIVGGVIGDYRFLGDVSALSVALAVEKVEHKESYSGQKALVRSFPIGKTATLNMTLRSIETENLAMVLYGKAINTPAGTVTGEDLGTIAVGDTVKLAQIGVKNLVITDSAGTPNTIDPSHYQLLDNGHFGEIVFNSLPTSPAPVMPLKAAYEHAPKKAVGMFTAPQPTVAIRYKGLNLAEGNAPVLIELYKVATDPLAELPLISDGTEVAGLSITGGILLDSSKPASGELGQFGAISQLA